MPKKDNLQSWSLKRFQSFFNEHIEIFNKENNTDIKLLRPIMKFNNVDEEVMLQFTLKKPECVLRCEVCANSISKLLEHFKVCLTQINAPIEGEHDKEVSDGFIDDDYDLYWPTQHKMVQNEEFMERAEKKNTSFFQRYKREKEFFGEWFE